MIELRVKHNPILLQCLIHEPMERICSFVSEVMGGVGVGWVWEGCGWEKS